MLSNDYSYTAFGNSDSKTEGFENNHEYAGEQLDPTGLYYNRARYYHPALGRFMNRDSVEGSLNSPQTMNRYSYVVNNPPKYTDPTGMYLCDDSGNDTISHAYSGFCDNRRDWLDNDKAFQVLAGNGLGSNSLAALIRLFSDEKPIDFPCWPYTVDHTLPGGSYGEAGRFRPEISWRTHFSPARERMNFVLWYSQSGFGLFNRVVAGPKSIWGATGLGSMYDDRNATGDLNSGQIGHLLTAIFIGFNSNFLMRSCAVGHELIAPDGDTRESVLQCLKGAGIWFGPENIGDYEAKLGLAVECDKRGNVSCVEDLIPKIVVLPEDIRASNDGRSFEDIRLTIRGIALGQKIRDNEIVSLGNVVSELSQLNYYNTRKN